MSVFRVGGAVRDALLGLPVKDIDYVVTGSTPEQMIAAGFTPAGKDFPVFLHPKTHAEYALARTERKSAPGYHGFVFHCAPDVTLEDDLLRRDLTINAMAIAEEDSGQNQPKIIDPFGGQRDLAAQVFRHVSAAFSEDPVRILRVARFAARLNTFTVAPETMQLMRDMVNNGEADALVPERVWQEIARGLMEQQPSRMMAILRETGALARVMPEMEIMLSHPDGSHIAGQIVGQVDIAVNNAARLGFSLPVRWAAMLGAGIHFTVNSAGMDGLSLITDLCARLKVPSEVRNIALLVAREHTDIEQALSLNPEMLVHLFERCDAFRRPERLIQAIQAIQAIIYQNDNNDHFPQAAFLEQALNTARAVSGGEIARKTQLMFPNQPQLIAKAIFAARADAIRQSAG